MILENQHKKSISIFQKYLNVFNTEILSGLILLFVSILALLLANSNFYSYYCHLLHSSFSISFGSHSISSNLHFFINDILMTFFFLSASIEIRCAIQGGSLSEFKKAIFPIVIAIGGVLFPAIIYLIFNFDSVRGYGWAIPTATDIAFSLGVLSILGKSISPNIRLILLSLSIIDDVIGVIIIALFYTKNLDINGILLFVLTISLIIFILFFRIYFSLLFIFLGFILWFSLFKSGVHPSLCGVILGCIIPFNSNIKKTNFSKHSSLKIFNQNSKFSIFKTQKNLYPWINFFIMPLFAFANSGIRLIDMNFHCDGAYLIRIGIILGLILGKPIGIITTGFLSVKFGFCKFPDNIYLGEMFLIGILASIGFTIAIFISNLAFYNYEEYSSIAKASIISSSAFSSIFGLLYGVIYIHFIKKN